MYYHIDDIILTEAQWKLLHRNNLSEIERPYSVYLFTPKREYRENVGIRFRFQTFEEAQ